MTVQDSNSQERGMFAPSGSSQKFPASSADTLQSRDAEWARFLQHSESQDDMNLGCQSKKSIFPGGKLPRSLREWLEAPARGVAGDVGSASKAKPASKKRRREE